MTDDADPETGDNPTPILRYDAGDLRDTTDELAAEEPLEIRVRGRAVSVTMRTPGPADSKTDEELAAGFCLTEGLVRRRADILRVEPCPRSEFGNRVDVILAPDVAVDFDRLTRHVFASSSCGLCGKATIDAIHNTFPPLPNDNADDSSVEPRAQRALIDPAILTTLPDRMRAAQATFARTGGLHAAALFTPTGELLALREDVGRHNALDKLIGHALLTGLLPLDRHILLVSGRTSFEILQKSLAARIPVIAAISAPTTLAVDFARRNHQTLIGFLRGQRMNVYSQPHRLKLPTAQLTTDP
jgi:FdhD protein